MIVKMIKMDFLHKSSVGWRTLVEKVHFNHFYYFISRYSAIPLSGFQLHHFSTLIGANGSHGIQLTFPRLFPAGRVQQPGR